MPTGALTFLQAAEEVLRKHSPGAPLHYRKITQIAVEEGLVSSKGLTPEQTMGAQLYSDIKRRAASGKPERFRHYGHGLFGLALPTDPLGGAIAEHNEEIRSRLRSLLAEMAPQAFEELIGNLLAALGFEDIEVTKYSGDGGIDVRAKLTVGGVTDVTTAVQVKRWANNVAGRTVRELRGGLAPNERGLIITLSNFTSDASDEASAPNKTPISLVNGDQLLGLLIDSEIGVTSRNVAILELDESGLLPTEAETPEAEDAPPTKQPLKKPSSYVGSKALSMWPLPGGRHAWKSTLEEMLQYIADTAPSLQQMVDWMIGHFHKVSSTKVARGYVNSVLRPLDLVESQGGHLGLSADGVSYMEDPSPSALFVVAKRNVAGFDEIVESLQHGPKSPAELLELVREKLGVSWETDAQVRFRLGWLENMGVVTEHAGEWTLKKG